MSWKNAKWSEIDDAYGAASAIPGLIGTVLSSEVGEAEVAIEQLRERLCHQGHNTPAALPMSHFLLEIFDAASPSIKPMVALLVADVAAGGEHVSSLWDRHKQLSTKAQSLLEGMRQPLHRAFEEQPAVRASFGVALATLTPDSVTQEVLSQWAGSESDPDSRATALLCVAAAGATVPPSEADEPVVVQAAHYAAARVLGREALTEERILDGLAILEELPSVTECEWAGGDLRQVVIWSITRAMGSTDVSMGEVLLDLVAGGPLGGAVASALLQSRLPPWSGPRLRTLDELNDDQRHLIEQLLDRDLLGPKVRDVIRRAGVFEQLAWLKRLLGRAAGPLDAECRPGEPWWRAINDVVNGRMDVTKLQSQVKTLTVDDVVALVEDSLMDYPVSRQWPPVKVVRESAEATTFDKLIDVLGELFRATKVDDQALLALIRTKESQFPDWRVAAAFAVRDRALVRQDGEVVEKLRALEPYEGVGPAVRRLLEG